jgi:uncharacterized protein (DUF433 family)
MPLTLVEHISIDPDVFHGRPCIRGTRIPVDVIFALHERDGFSPEQIAADFSWISLSDVYAALSYYHDHRAEIEQMLVDEEARIEQWKRDNPGAWREFTAP